MSPNRRIFLNIVATYGRSLYALVIGLFCGRWTLMARRQDDGPAYLPLIGGLCYNTQWFTSLNEPWCESPRRYGVEESLAHIFYFRRVA